MADPARRRPHNAAGPWFVDDTCIDCGTCMWMAPETFAEADGMSAVHHQPGDGDERASAALLACPTGSIGGPAGKVEFPRPIAGVDGVWHCGFHDRRSFGATPYLVATGAGRVMVDVPRFAAPLRKQIDDGGLQHIVLTHQDDVAAHAEWHTHTGAPRAIHQHDDHIGAEVLLTGRRGRVAGMEWFHVPGHTRGSVVFRHGDVLFSGDHVAGSVRHPERLRAFRGACWYDWREQTKSMAMMADWDVAHVLPGHGAPWHGTAQGYREAMGALVDWMRER